MKKLLLFLLFFSFIGSANADSIKGAFGYKLGQVMKNVPTEHEKSGIKHYFYSEQNFIPQKPLPGFNRYYFETTFTNKKIYRIVGQTSEKSSDNNSCDEKIWVAETGNEINLLIPVDSDFGKIKVMLEAKYGDFKEVQYENEWGFDDNNNPWDRRLNEYQFNDGNRSINLYCIRDSRGYHQMRLIYIDHKLDKLADEEHDDMVNKYINEESSDYDI
jgi:hypothetical protein